MAYIPDYATLLAFTAAALVLTVTPGPDMTLFMSKTLTQGRRAGLAAVFGATCGLILHTVLAAIGVSALLSASALAFTVLKIVGAAYLIYLAVQAVRNGSSLALEAASVKRQPIHRVWLQALGINILNPKIVLFFVTFLPQFVSAADPNATGKLMFLGFYFVVLGMPICAAMVLGASAFARFLKSSPKFMRAFDWAFAGIMGTFALKLLVAKANS
ncbi:MULTISPECIES: LysE family translocator [Stappiaceae]|jgi:threonine/homoserine/homoserine lactone efflux protein|uniref:LysE family translocator n=1 Tax=Stappiaceae TaxID=2821832 RepID=UPI00094ADAEA|nr:MULTISPECIES: LysE family translocator [Stappiaceae]MCR9282179.1 LysE family translocator [Paracoccaceae bacterium]MBO6860742.1 LysE family translocator [Roseibium sp.]MBO9458923.1 LysE family translocator [Labrenzia sp. R5_0]UES51135.1 LysE family translocator [Roseibium aggregatum]UFI01616.1 LysE family translocator [Roseibium aggregatum]